MPRSLPVMPLAMRRAQAAMAGSRLFPLQVSQSEADPWLGGERGAAGEAEGAAGRADGAAHGDASASAPAICRPTTGGTGLRLPETVSASCFPAFLAAGARLASSCRSSSAAADQPNPLATE